MGGARERQPADATPGRTLHTLDRGSGNDQLNLQRTPLLAMPHHRRPRRVEAAMRRALSLAEHGPVTGGNPQVGCVLVDAQR